MPVRRPTARHASSAPARVLAALGGVVAFLGIASLIEPSNVPAAAFDWPRQSPNSPTGSTPSPTSDAQPSEGVLLVTLVGGDYTVEVYAGNPEPVYTVYDAAGYRVADRLPKSDVYRIDPALDIDSMMGSAMGLVEDSDF